MMWSYWKLKCVSDFDHCKLRERERNKSTTKKRYSSTHAQCNIMYSLCSCIKNIVSNWALTSLIHVCSCSSQIWYLGNAVAAVAVAAGWIVRVLQTWFDCGFASIGICVNGANVRTPASPRTLYTQTLIVSCKLIISRKRGQQRRKVESSHCKVAINIIQMEKWEKPVYEWVWVREF